MSLVEHVRGKAILIVAVYCAIVMPAYAQNTSPVHTGSQPNPGLSQSSTTLYFVRSFASAKDIEPPLHPILDRTLDILAGPADPSARVESLQLPSAVIANSRGQVFVADPGAKAVHIFDFSRSRYGLLDARGDHLGSPVALAVDAKDNLYVSDQTSTTILVYDGAGKFRRRLGRLRGREAYFESVGGITVDRRTGNLYVCDALRNMVVVMDGGGHLVGTIGKRGGGNQPGEFRSPSQVVIGGGELFVLDAGNRRAQILDLKGHFRGAIQLVYADQGSGLAVDLGSNIYVSDPVLNTIEVFSHEGKLLYQLDPSAGGDGEFYHPTGLWVSENNCLYVVDAGEHRRIAVFQIGRNKARQCRAGR